MKSTGTMLAITALAALALVGCNQNTPTDTQTTNSSINDAGGAVVGTTNMPSTNSLPDVNTNKPATIIFPDTNTNLPANTNQ